MIQADVSPIIDLIFNFIRDILNFMYNIKIIFGLSLIEIILAMFVLNILWTFVKMGDNIQFKSFAAYTKRYENYAEKRKQKLAMAKKGS